MLVLALCLVTSSEEPRVFILLSMCKRIPSYHTLGDFLQELYIISHYYNENKLERHNSITKSRCC